MKIIFVCLIVIFTINFSKGQWSLINPPNSETCLSVHFPNPNIGYIAAGANYCCTSGSILKSSDSGATWNEVYYNSNNTMRSIFFLNQDTGFAFGAHLALNDVILKTIDGGNTWNSCYDLSTAGALLKAGYFLNPDTGFAVGSCTILKTINSGQSWEPLNISTSSLLYSISFASKDTGYIVGDWGTILKTTDGGSNWFFLQNNGWPSYYSVFFINSQIGHVIGYGSMGPTTGTNIYKQTLDGGVSWTSYNVAGASSLKAVYFINKNSGFIIDGSGGIFKTINGGKNWYKQISGTTMPLYSVYFTDSLNGFIVGYNVILKTSNGGTTWLDYTEKVNNVISVSPNPVNSFIKIEIPYSSKQNVLIIYNLNGIELMKQTLLDTKTIIDISSFSNGIYFLKIITDKGIMKQKILKE